MGKDVCIRSNVYAGMLMRRPDCVIEARDNFGEPLSSIMNNNGRRRDGTALSEKEIIKIKRENEGLAAGTFVRGILFGLTPEITGDDLVYTDSNYEVSKHTPLTETDDKFKIDTPINLDGLLRFLGYKENLNQRDINRIYRTLICSQRILHSIMKKYEIKYNKDGELIAGKEGAPCSLETIRCLDVISSRKHNDPSINEPKYKTMEKKR